MNINDKSFINLYQKSIHHTNITSFQGISSNISHTTSEYQHIDNYQNKSLLYILANFENYNSVILKSETTIINMQIVNIVLHQNMPFSTLQSILTNLLFIIKNYIDLFILQNILKRISNTPYFSINPDRVLPDGDPWMYVPNRRGPEPPTSPTPDSPIPSDRIRPRERYPFDIPHQPKPPSDKPSTPPPPTDKPPINHGSQTEKTDKNDKKDKIQEKKTEEASDKGKVSKIFEIAAKIVKATSKFLGILSKALDLLEKIGKAIKKPIKTDHLKEKLNQISEKLENLAENLEKGKVSSHTLEELIGIFSGTTEILQGIASILKEIVLYLLEKVKSKAMKILQEIYDNPQRIMEILSKNRKFLGFLGKICKKLAKLGINVSIDQLFPIVGSLAGVALNMITAAENFVSGLQTKNPVAKACYGIATGFSGFAAAVNGFAASLQTAGVLASVPTAGTSTALTAVGQVCNAFTSALEICSDSFSLIGDLLEIAQEIIS